MSNEIRNLNNSCRRGCNSNTNDFLTLAGGIIITFTKEILNMIVG